MTEKYWDLGEVNFIRPSKNSLSKILNALILCKGKLHCSHSLEIKNNEWKYSSRDCAVLLRISLPEGTEERFQELSGFTLSEPPKIHLN